MLLPRFGKARVSDDGRGLATTQHQPTRAPAVICAAYSALALLLMTCISMTNTGQWAWSILQEARMELLPGEDQPVTRHTKLSSGFRQDPLRTQFDQPIMLNPATPVDILAVMVTCRRDLELARAHKLWRKHDVHAVFLLSDHEKLSPAEEAELAAENVTVGYFPDYQYCGDGSQKHSHENPSDRRQALAPFLGHMLRPNFKWMINIDTDSLVFRHGLWELTRSLDWEEPLWITGAVCCRQGGNCARFSCPLCGVKDTGSNTSTASGQPGAAAGTSSPCTPCTPRSLCEQDSPGAVESCLADGWPVPYGGTGGLYSIGFFKDAISRGLVDSYKQCVMTSDLSHTMYQGGDGLMGYCKWVNNITMRYPDVNPLQPAHGPRFGSLGIHELARAAAELVPPHDGNPPADVAADIREKLRYTVTTHVWRRKFSSRKMPDFYVRTVDYLLRAYEMALVAAGIVEA